MVRATTWVAEMSCGCEIMTRSVSPLMRWFSFVFPTPSSTPAMTADVDVEVQSKRAIGAAPASAGMSPGLTTEEPYHADAPDGDVAAAASSSSSAAVSIDAPTVSQDPAPPRYRRRKELRRIVLHFTPSWFSVNMGTGIVSILLHELPYQFRGLGIISNIVFRLNSSHSGESRMPSSA